MTFKHKFLLKKVKKFTQITHAFIFAFTIFFKLLNTFTASQFEFKVMYKQYNKIDFLHWIVAPQL